MVIDSFTKKETNHDNVGITTISGHFFTNYINIFHKPSDNNFEVLYESKS
jgi:hypothetical protein